MNKQRSGKPSRVRFGRPWGNRRAYPAAEGLYLPEMEHDACGVGMTCHIKGKKSHDIVQDALRILINLSHRGAGRMR